MATKPKTAKKKTQDIPLGNIPERATKQQYTDDFKMSVVKRVQAGESPQAIALELKIPSASIIHNWRARVDKGLPVTQRSGPVHKPGGSPESLTAVLRQSLERATKQRDERLEVAACIVEADGGGREAEQLAKKIRAYKHAKPPG